MDIKKLREEDSLIIIESILEELHEGICITDGNGIILKTGKSCELLYGIKGNYEGKHISILEEEGAFSPSLSLIALKERKKVTMTQPDKFGRSLLVTATPIFNKDTDEILFVVSYASWDVTNILELQKRYNQLKKEIEKNNLELNTFKKGILSVEIIAKSPKMLIVKKIAEKAAKIDIDILITGESGTGKSTLAKYIHKISQRRNQPFVKLSCSAFSGDIIGDELFGYIKTNPLTGEEIDKVGLCEIADTGTLFLEDIENMTKETQGTLLYLIKNKCYYKRNSEEAKKVDIRIMATSRKNLTALSQELREGLFYNLSVVSAEMPALKERKEDIPEFMNFFLQHFNEKFCKNLEISPETENLLISYNWPGNITEFKYIIQQLVLSVEEEVIRPFHLPENISPFASNKFLAHIDLKEYIDYYESRLILQAYEKCKTTVKLAQYLGISQSSAVRKLKKYIPNYS